MVNNNNDNIMKKLIITSGVISIAFTSMANKISKKDYVEQWKSVAIGEMLDHGIPASITLAQGILESGSGNSTLAVEGKNHFGIKCHGWAGEKIYLDDDKQGECFRVYDSADQSYEDHSDFLLEHGRYAFLFDYKVTDYKSWAKGLKQAGYATNPKYPSLLIDLIEELGLNEYDTYSDLQMSADVIAQENTESVESTEILANTHSVYVQNNKVKYVVAKKGDTYYTISKEFGLHLRQLYKYNSFESNKEYLEEGDVVYIMPKKKASLFKKEEIKADQDMTIQEISQKYAVSEKSIRRLNHFADDFLVAKGEIVTLR